MGSSFAALHFQFMKGKRTILALQPLFMPPPNESKWKRIAERYLDLCNLPNWIGSIDGEHGRIKYFPKAGSLYFNYKGYFSVILLACADADALFTAALVGDFGKNSDGSV
jgi:hypothetical protein